MHRKKRLCLQDAPDVVDHTNIVTDLMNATTMHDSLQVRLKISGIELAIERKKSKSN